MTAHDPATNVTRTPKEIASITQVFDDILTGKIGHLAYPGKWVISRSEDRTTITFTDLVRERALAGITADWVGESVQPEYWRQTITADEVQTGDKIEVTIPIEVIGERGTLLRGELDTHGIKLLKAKSDAMTIRLIERPLKPIAVGDRVHHMPIEKDDPIVFGTVRHVEDGWASVKWDGQPGLGVSDLRYLTRAPVSPSA